MTERISQPPLAPETTLPPDTSAGADVDESSPSDVDRQYDHLFADEGTGTRRGASGTPEESLDAESPREIMRANWSLIQELVTEAGASLADIGAPPVKARPAGGIHEGEFDRQLWTLSVNEKGLSEHHLEPEEVADYVNIVNHEVRHGYQDALLARYLAQQATPRQQITEFGYSPDVAWWARSNPLPPGSPEEGLAHTFYESLHGSGAAYRNSVFEELAEVGQELADIDEFLDRFDAPGATPAPGEEESVAAARARHVELVARHNEAFAAYRALPNEADAFEVGNAAEAAYRASAGLPPGEPR